MWCYLQAIFIHKMYIFSVIAVKSLAIAHFGQEGFSDIDAEK